MMNESLRRHKQELTLFGLMLLSACTPATLPTRIYATETPTPPHQWEQSTPTITPTLTETPLPTVISLATREPTREIITKPTPEPILSVAPGDVLVALFENSPLEKNWVIIKEDGRRQQISSKNARAYQENGAVIPPWLAKDLNTQFLLSPDSRQVIGGLVKSSPSTYTPVCSYDQKAGGFSWPPAVHWDGQYVAVVQEGNRLRLCDFPPHHEGVSYALPSMREIKNNGFGAGKHKNDLLVTGEILPQKFVLLWLKNFMVTEFPEPVMAANHAAIHPASEIKMRYLKGAIPRSPKHQIVPELLLESSTPLQAMVIWNSFP